MKALTLTQPWATLVAIGAKRIETRSWPTRYRGPVAIHAAKGLSSIGGHSGLINLCLEQPFARVLAMAGKGLLVPGHDLPLGEVLATAQLIDCIPTYRVAANVSDQEEAFGDFSPGRWAWMLADIRQLPTPVPARGSLGLWNWQP